MKKNTKSKNSILSKVLIAILAVLFYSCIILSIIFYNPDGISIEENRKLAKMPVFTIESALNGTLVDEFDTFLSDNFFNRSKFIKISSLLHSIYSLDTFFESDTITFLDDNFYKESNQDTAYNETSNEVNILNDNINSTDNDSTLGRIAPEALSNQSMSNMQEDIEMKGSFILYKGQPYFTGYSTPEKYKKTANVINSYVPYKGMSNISVLPAPTRSAFIDDEEVINAVGNQKEHLTNFLSLLDDEVKKINVTHTFDKHIDEYLYYFSDHHWTALGCYYAYVEFCKQNNITPYPLSHFREEVLNDNFAGTVFSYTKDGRTLKFKDIVYGYYPTKKCEMTKYELNGLINHYDNCIVNPINGYRAFIGGDSRLCIIDVKENDEENTLLILKDSFANGLVPFLVEHYSKIVIFDPRYSSMSLYDYMKYVNEEPIIYKDILIATHFFETSYTAWPDQLKNALGNPEDLKNIVK